MTTTTSMFQINPDYYDNLDNIKKERKKISTNPKYKNKGFYQTHFTAGDIEQFQQYRYPYNSSNPCKKIDIDQKNLFFDQDIDNTNSIQWNKYKDLNPVSVDNTFNYIFHKFKKGIFVKILDNELKVFLPFSKVNYTNEWSQNIKINPKFNDMQSFATHINSLIGNKYRVSVNKFSNQWYGNNCMIRYEFPVGEGDTNNPSVSNMLKILCKKRKIPDIEFFLNRRDFPIIKKNETEAYNHLFNNNNLPLVSHNYSSYTPILSYCSTNEFADILIPTWDDWNRISSYEGRFFPKGKKYHKQEEFNTPWSEKLPTAVFRGTTTGCGIDEKTNMRIKIAYLSTIQETSTPPLLDAKVSSWQVRPKQIQGNKYLETIDVKRFEQLGLKTGFLSPIEQSKYKYIVNIDGNVSAFRLSLELSMGCCVLLVKSQYKIWYSHILIPYRHYIPIESDLSNLFDIIKWCRDNDKKCEEIARNAKEFYNTYLMEDGQLDYLQKTLIEIKKTTGTYLYNSITPEDIQLKLQMKFIENKNTKEIINIGNIPKQGRNYGLLEGLRMLINKIDFFEKADHKDSKYSLAGFSFSSKEFNVNDVFVGMKVINNLVKYIPNFVYTFCFNDKYTITEYINGKSLTDWIKNDKFSIKEFLFILIQINLSLQIAQKKYGFVHHNLKASNVVIIELPKPISFDYLIDIDNIFRIETIFIPVIINYKDSNVIYNNLHYGFVFSSIQDVLSIVFDTVNHISQLNNSKETVIDLIKLMNFISGTKYRKNSFRMTGLKGVSDLQYFFKTTNLYSNKYELEERTPLDLVNYILMNWKEYKFNIEKIQNPIFRIDRGNAKQVYDYIISENEDDKIKSYLNLFNNVVSCDLIEKDNNLFFNYYILQTIESNISSVFNLCPYKEHKEIIK